MDPVSPIVHKYFSGQKVNVCFEGGTILTAFIATCENLNDKPHYKVLLLGKDKVFNELISEEKIKQYSAENRQLATTMSAKTDSDQVKGSKDKSPEVKFKFNLGQQILCFNTNKLLYLAKVNEQRVELGKPQYFVHFIGWSRDFNDWYDESSLRSYSPENLRLSQELVAKRSLEIKEEMKKIKKKSHATDVHSHLFTFSVGQEVSCFYKGIPYYAKCLATEMRQDQPHYLIHYKGWGALWDEWVTDERLKPFDEDHINLSKPAESPVKSKSVDQGDAPKKNRIKAARKSTRSQP